MFGSFSSVPPKESMECFLLCFPSAGLGAGEVELPMVALVLESKSLDDCELSITVETGKVFLDFWAGEGNSIFLAALEVLGEF